MTGRKKQKEKIQNHKIGLWEKLFWRICASGFMGTLVIIRILPECFLPTLGEWLGVVGYYLTFPRQKIARGNIRRVFGATLSEKQIKSIAKSAFKNMSRDMLEVGLSYVGPRDQSFLKKNFSVQGTEHLDQALKKGKGVIAVSVHMGNFTLLSGKMVTLGYPFSLIFKNPKNSYLVNTFQQWRDRLGIGLIPYKPRHRCASESLNVLKKNGVVMMLIDQNPPRKSGVYVDFFGYQLPTYSGAIILALKSGAALLPMFVHRNADNTETITILPEIPLKKSPDKERDIVEHMRAIHVICEEWIKKYPEQWWWMHRRFRRAKKIVSETK